MALVCIKGHVIAEGLISGKLSDCPWGLPPMLQCCAGRAGTARCRSRSTARRERGAPLLCEPRTSLENQHHFNLCCCVCLACYDKIVNYIRNLLSKLICPNVFVSTTCHSSHQMLGSYVTAVTKTLLAASAPAGLHTVIARCMPTERYRRDAGLARKYKWSGFFIDRGVCWPAGHHSTAHAGRNAAAATLRPVPSLQSAWTSRAMRRACAAAAQRRSASGTSAHRCVLLCGQPPRVCWQQGVAHPYGLGMRCYATAHNPHFAWHMSAHRRSCPSLIKPVWV